MSGDNFGSYSNMYVQNNSIYFSLEKYFAKVSTEGFLHWSIGISNKRFVASCVSQDE